jgi:hypothetical protein
MKKNINIFPLLILLIFFLVETFPSDQIKIKSKDHKDTVWIFNGKDLSNLKFVPEKTGTNLNDIFMIRNNAVIFQKDCKGYIRTKEKYSEFKLHAEWRWPEKGEKGNSGILLFIQKPDTVWPNCIQVNFKENHAGDLIAMNGAKFKEASEIHNDIVPLISKTTERPEGKWNSCDLVSEGDSLIVQINGVIKNKAKKIVNNSGMVGWQLEGKPIELKNIFLIKK